MKTHVEVPTTNSPSSSSQRVLSSKPIRAKAAQPNGNKFSSPRTSSKSATNAHNAFLTGEEWLHLRTEVNENQIVIGTPGQAIVRTGTKNLIEAPEKAFKTTFALRLMLGLSAGMTIFPKLPVVRARTVLYVHGELSPHEIRERTRAAAVDLPRPIVNFFQGRDLRIHLGKSDGQKILKEIVAQIRPNDLVLDPWQGFMPGFDENEFRDVSLATHFMDELIEEFGVTIYLVTHTGKDHSRGTRGHSSLAGWRDSLFKLDRKNGLVTVKIEPRWAAPVEPFNLEFRDGTVWSTEKSGFTRQAEDIRKFLERKHGHSTKEQLGEHLKMNGDALRKALKRAEAANAIVIDGDHVRLPEAEEPNAVDVLGQE
jgi:hypothetical protein